MGSAFTWKGVSDLPRPIDDGSVAGVRMTDRGVANAGVNTVDDDDDGGPIELFLLIGVICH
jgi:hypothetical protein